MTPRLKERYTKEIIAAMMKEFAYGNIMEVPKVEKVVLNVGLGEAIQNIKLLDAAQKELALMFAKGEGTQPSYEQAAKWFRAAAEQGDAEAEGDGHQPGEEQRRMGDDDLAAGPDFHPDDALGEPWDHAVQRERGRLSPLEGAVELGPI